MIASDLPPVSAIVQALDLAPNPQGGWFRAIHQVEHPSADRPVANAINYLLDSDAPICFLHRMSADAMHYFHRGCPLAVITISPQGHFERVVLGPDLTAGHRLQVYVPGGWWKAFELVGEPWSLISEAVAPGWIPEDQQTATRALLDHDLAPLRARIERFVMP